MYNSSRAVYLTCMIPCRRRGEGEAGDVRAQEPLEKLGSTLLDLTQSTFIHRPSRAYDYVHDIESMPD